MSHAELGKALKVPEQVVMVLEQPERSDEELVGFFAAALGVTPGVLTGQEMTEEEKRAAEMQARAAAAAQAKYPQIRHYLLAPEHCADPEKAVELFGNQPLSIPERNLLLYLTTSALYHFCDTNTSSFALDHYLFRLHGPLFERYQKQLAQSGLTAEEREEQLDKARSDVFRCESMRNIAILVAEDLAAELERKIQDGDAGFEEDVAMPFTWELDERLMQIIIREPDGSVRDEVRLLDVKERPSA
jgi:hypothetical protein